MNPYAPLPLVSVNPGASLPNAGDAPRIRTSLQDRALPMMTDLRHQARVTVFAAQQVDEALEDMARAGVKFAFVVEDDPGRRLVGCVTAYDIQGEKPMRHLQSVDCSLDTCSRDDVRVCHVMERVDEWQVLELDVVRSARIGQIVATMRALSRRHLIVVDPTEVEGPPVICGLLSATALERCTGIAVGMTHTAMSFVEIERVLHH